MCAVVLMTSSLNNIAYAGVKAEESQGGSPNLTGNEIHPRPMSEIDAKLVTPVVASTWDMDQNCGLRVTVIDKKGKAVTNSVDILSYNVFELLTAIKNAGTGNVNSEAVINKLGIDDDSKANVSTGAFSSSGSANNKLRLFIDSLYDRDANGKRRGIDILQDSSGADEYENVADGAIILIGSKLDDTSIESSSKFANFFGSIGISLYKSAGNANGQVVGKLAAGEGGLNHKTKDIKITTFSKMDHWLMDNCDSKLKDSIDLLVKESLPSNSNSGRYFSELLKLGNDMGHSGEVAKAFINWKDGSDYLLGFINDDDSRLVTDKKTPYDVCREKGYKLIIEPVIWTMPYLTDNYNQFGDKSKRTKEFISLTGNNIIGYLSSKLVYGSVTQVEMCILGLVLYNHDVTGLKASDIAGLQSVSPYLSFGGDDLLQVTASTYTLARNEPEINGGMIAPLKSAGYPIYDPNNNVAISADNMITGSGLNNWRMVGYACGILDINELAKPSTGTSSKNGVPDIDLPDDKPEHSKVVKIYLDKEGDEMRQTGYFETENWHTGDVSVPDETHDDGKEYKVYKWVVSKTDKDLSGYENGTKLI